ncbi:hypothetical protein [Cryobacterium sp. SO1]|nr:hypothetical protein [Cryobacterium sp. SO1]RZI37244.1 hypothetical protein BJQ95_00351 [Cryobacterium sp. SO1]
MRPSSRIADEPSAETIRPGSGRFGARRERIRLRARATPATSN